MNDEHKHTTVTMDDTVEVVCESIETNLWLSEAYFQRGIEELAAECARSAWQEYQRFAEVLRAYLGGDALRDRLMAAMATHPGIGASLIESGFGSFSRPVR